MADVPILSTLVENFGPELVWWACVNSLGHPPWTLSMNDALKVQEYLIP